METTDRLLQTFGRKEPPERLIRQVYPGEKGEVWKIRNVNVNEMHWGCGRQREGIYLSIYLYLYLSSSPSSPSSMHSCPVCKLADMLHWDDLDMDKHWLIAEVKPSQIQIQSGLT